MKAIKELPYNFLVNINPLGSFSLLVLGDGAVQSELKNSRRFSCVPTSFWQAPKRAGHRFVANSVAHLGAFFGHTGCGTQRELEVVG